MRTAASLLVVSLVAASLLPAGCNIVAPAVYFIGGPAKTPPQFELPKDNSVVVFVDDRANILPNRSTRQRIAKATEKALAEGKALEKGDILSSDAILTISAQERFGKPMGISEVGKAVGAKTVIYAKVETFGLSPNGTEMAPFATLKVKVIDVESRKRLWPTEDREWATAAFTSPVGNQPLPQRSSDRVNAEYQLAESIGLSLARLFIEWVPEDVAERVGG